MYGLRYGQASPLAIAGIIGLSIVTAALGGCSTTEAASDQAATSGRRVYAEVDGLPAQAAPPAWLRQMPDDPSEPYSPNYGAPVPVHPAAGSGRMSLADEEAIIAAAITAHEIRNP